MLSSEKTSKSSITEVYLIAKPIRFPVRVIILPVPQKSLVLLQLQILTVVSSSRVNQMSLNPFDRHLNITYLTFFAILNDQTLLVGVP